MSPNSIWLMKSHTLSRLVLEIANKSVEPFPEIERLAVIGKNVYFWPFKVIDGHMRSPYSIRLMKSHTLSRMVKEIRKSVRAVSWDQDVAVIGKNVFMWPFKVKPVTWRSPYWKRLMKSHTLSRMVKEIANKSVQPFPEIEDGCGAIKCRIKWPFKVKTVTWRSPYWKRLMKSHTLSRMVLEIRKSVQPFPRSRIGWS